MTREEYLVRMKKTGESTALAVEYHWERRDVRRRGERGGIRRILEEVS